jgi:hypothetical protein
MLVAAFLSWWYGRGWKSLTDSFVPRMQGVADSFSVSQLIRTWFAPWRRIITEPGRSLEEKWRAAIDNGFSRVIGFIVRSCVLLAAALTILFIGLLTVVEIIVWPLLPLAIPGCIIVGLFI